MKKRRSDGATQRRRGRRSGFTLTELMVAVLILIVVIISTSKIFGTVGRVAGVGEAGAEVLQEAAAIERQVRSDFERLSREGFLMIRCVAVPNDVNVAAGGPLLNPALAPSAYIRADQIIFFAQGAQSMETMLANAGVNRKGQSAVSRVYYGHGFQVPGGQKVDQAGLPAYVEAFDPEITAGLPIVPWSRGTHNQVKTKFETVPSPNDYTTTGAGTVNVTQPPATDWLLARQAIVLARDDDPFDPTPNPNVFLSTGFGNDIGNRSAKTITDATVINGRVDAAAQELSDIRAVLRPDADDNGFADLGWLAQRAMVAQTLFYPRVEREAPSMHRVDQALTNNVLANACSSFIIDWTWTDGVGRGTDDTGTFHRGATILDSHEQIWFGLDPYGTRGVGTFTQYVNLTGWDAGTIDEAVIEPVTPTPATQDIRLSNSNVLVYEAIFGLNQDTPLEPVTGQPWSPTAGPAAYTPWPTSIRFRMTLHDADLQLETGREFEFVVNLPGGDAS